MRQLRYTRGKHLHRSRDEVPPPTPNNNTAFMHGKLILRRRYHLMSAPRRLKLRHDFRRRRYNPYTSCSVRGHVTLCSSLVGTSSYSAPAAHDQPHIYQQKRARSDGNIFQAISAPNDGIAYDPSMAAGAGAGASQAAPRRSQQVVAPPRPVPPA
jgi:hypothetical protein